MFNVRLSALGLAGLTALTFTFSRAETLQEDFASDPTARGWQVVGDTNLFHWDAASQNLQVTWDSTRPNSYFYHSLGTIVNRNDDFAFSFDLRLSDVNTGDSTGPLQLALGLLNLADATQAGFARGAGICPNLVEFDYYPAGFFPGFASPAEAQPAFIDSSSMAFAPTYVAPYNLELPTNQVLHIALTYTASNQTAVLTLTSNGVTLAKLPDLVLSDPGTSTFASTNDFRVNVFSISSYSEAGQFPPYVGSILAHGSVDNLMLTVPPPPLRNLAGGLSNWVWQVRFDAATNWLYTLERTTNFVSWGDASLPTDGNGTSLVLQDTNAPAGAAFYRVRADRP